ncbi:hypothetical protein BDQ94DRAFT_132725 [Aspergillus welwitschiae]|uniref:Uncharacterized protein n=1 Tax=Aspergillus welwitschiae TaxID=1341132 RepID=A0A3F3QK64_9EURO|nr:hypothetical protein BDQ94DRAFT_132725 [Aspergillus welwitschiae]RDH39242.1 hypothetical protein BDQ94DRAFT_132725 [Aspergillus welwitschiae]
MKSCTEPDTLSLSLSLFCDCLARTHPASRMYTIQIICRIVFSFWYLASLQLFLFAPNRRSST